MRFIIIIFLVAAGACNNTNSSKVTELNTSEMEALLLSSSDLQLVDLRTPSEIDQGYIGDPIFINYQDDNLKTELDKLDKNKPIVLYCAAGGRSGRTTNIAEEMGFSDIYDYTEGFNGWSGAGKPINKRN